MSNYDTDDLMQFLVTHLGLSPDVAKVFVKELKEFAEGDGGGMTMRLREYIAWAISFLLFGWFLDDVLIAIIN